MKYGLGQPVTRKEDARLVTGKGRYVDDIRLDGQAHAHIVYSDRAHALLRKVHPDRAKAAPGVLAVLTGRDVAVDGLGPIKPRFMPQDLPFGWPPAYRTERPILVSDRVRHVGERIAMVVAETREQARDAAELIEIEYEDQPAAIGAKAAIAEGAALVHPEWKSNRVWTVNFGNREATDAAFANTAHRIKVAVSHPRVAPSPMEPRVAVGTYSPQDDLYTLYTGTQAPHILRSEIATFVLNVPETCVRVISPDVGGAFGLKTTPFAEDALVLWAARKVGRPVKWLGSRSDCMMSDDQGRGQTGEVEIALDSEGMILGLRCRLYHDVGAYIVGAGTMPMVHAAKLSETVYRVPAADIEGTLVFTHTPPTTPYRGAGRPEAVFAMEKCLDKAARQLGIDRLEIRRRNMIKPGELPYKTHSGFIYDSGEFSELLDHCADMADWKGYQSRKRESDAAGKLRGLGLAYYTHDTGNLNDRMEIRFDPAGTVTVVSGAANTGMGHETVFAQAAAEWLGVPYETVRVIGSDTQSVSYGRGSYASRSMTVCASALRIAADKVIEKGKTVAGRLLEADSSIIDFDAGVFRVAETNKTISMVDVARASFRNGMPIENGIGLEAVGTFAVTQSSFPNGCHICEVEVDPATGETNILRYTVVDDFGRVLNPLLAEGQVHGGIAQGLGAVFFERMAYDETSGQLLSGSFMDYGLPRADLLPRIKTAFREVPCKTNPAGVKGAGEGGTVGATSALLSAVNDALHPLGIEDVQLPLTPQKLWQAIRDAQ